MGLFGKLFGGKKENGYTPSDALMDESQFWTIIQNSYDKAGGKYDAQMGTLASQLRKISLQDLILFDNRFRQLRGQAYTWPLWGAAYIIHGGCSDDGFMDFRSWLIAQGRSFYHRALQDPGTLVEVNSEKFEEDWEGIIYVAAEVFEERTEENIPSEYDENQTLTGQEWQEEGDDLARMFPALWEKYA